MADSLIPAGAVEVARIVVAAYINDDGHEEFAVVGTEFGNEGMAVWKQLGMLAQAMTLTGASSCRAAGDRE